MKPRLCLLPAPAPKPAARPVPAPYRADSGGISLENAARTSYASARTRGGRLAPLPLSESEALAEAAILYPALMTRHTPNADTARFAAEVVANG